MSKILNRNTHTFVTFENFTAVTMKNTFSRMWRRVDIMLTDVLEERIASIFRVVGLHH
jgi:hypothetical protein